MPKVINQLQRCSKYLIGSYTVNMAYMLWPVLRAAGHWAKLCSWISSLNPNSLLGKQLQWRHYVGSLQLSKYKPSLRKRKKREKKWVFRVDNRVNTVAAQRGNTCVLPNFWHGAIWSLPEPFLVWVQIRCRAHSDDKMLPDSFRKLQSQSQIRSEWTGEIREGAEMIQLCWWQAADTQTRVGQWE